MDIKNIKIHECHDPIHVRTETHDRFECLFGTCPDCKKEWCYGIINLDAAKKLNIWRHTK